MKRSIAAIAMAVATLAVLLLGVAPASAGTKGGLSMPDSITVDDTPLVLNGMGIREATILKVDVYVAGLYLERRSGDPAAILASNERKQLSLHFVRDVDHGDITDAWNEGFKKNAPDQLKQLRARIDKLNGWMSDIKKGEELVFTFRPGKGVTVSVKGTSKGTIEGDDFARALLSIWLGDPPNQGLKDGLLGKSKS